MPQCFQLGSALRGYPLEYETYPLSFKEFCRFRKIATSRSEQLKLLHRLIQVTWSIADDDTFQISGKRIDVVPAWEWLPGNDWILSLGQKKLRLEQTRLLHTKARTAIWRETFKTIIA